MKFRAFLTPLLFLTLGLSGLTAGETPTAQSLTEHLDMLRRPPSSFEVKVTVNELHDGKTTQTSIFRVMAGKRPGSSAFDAMALCQEPAADRGKTVLTQGKEIWFFDPKGKHPTQISAHHFRGKFYALDSISTNLNADYSSDIVGEETIKDAARTEVTCVVLRLHRREKNSLGMNTDVIDFWLDKKFYQPIRAQFYGSGNKIQRTVYYAGYSKVLGETRPTRLLVVSNTERGLVTDVKFSDYTLHDWPADLFTKGAMEKVSHGEMP